MTMHASADLRNVERSILVALNGAGLGAPVVPDGDEKFDSSTATATGFVRVSFRTLPETPQGRVVDGGATLQAVRASAMVVAEVFGQGNAGEGTVYDAIDGLTSKVAHALRYANVAVKDYVSDPTGATSVTGVVCRFVRPPEVQRVPPSDGWHRRIVLAEGHWFLRHAA